MQINTVQNRLVEKNNRRQNISHKGAREMVRTLANPDALASTIVLESSVTGGRGYNAYKRGGAAELRERAFDDIVSAVFWMKGVDIFNSLGNKFGAHVLKLPTTEFDVGKDALRTPFKNVVGDLAKKTTDSEALKKLEKKLAVFKFSKIILSTLLATGFVGFALPKINQAITRKIMHRGKAESELQQTLDDKSVNKRINPTERDLYSQLTSVTFDEFNRKITAQNNPAFKGISPNVMTTVAHYLENNKVCKLLSSDVGILTGRVTTARNKDEGLEYLFRDASSSFFYIASTPLMYSLLQKVTGSSKYTSIDPVAAKQVHDMCVKQLQNADGTFASMGVKEFTSKILGTLDDKAKELISRLPFNSDVISLSELSKYIDDESLLKKASELAKLQPKQAGVGAVLTKQQVADVLKNGTVSEPEFMQKVFTGKFGDSLTNPYKFIPMKKITTFRDNIDDYAKSVIDMANKTNNGIVDKKLLDKLNKKSFAMSAGFRAIAIAVSAFALGIAIPKIQYAITAKRTGSNAAPGLREFEQSEVKKAQNA